MDFVAPASSWSAKIYSEYISLGQEMIRVEFYSTFVPGPSSSSMTYTIVDSSTNVPQSYIHRSISFAPALSTKTNKWLRSSMASRGLPVGLIHGSTASSLWQHLFSPITFGLKALTQCRCFRLYLAYLENEDPVLLEKALSSSVCWTSWGTTCCKLHSRVV
jgi:hypothetical protein